MKKLLLNNVSEINQINDVMHDQWFDIEEIMLEKNILSIKFKKERNDKRRVKRNFIFWKEVIIPIEECFLCIHNVEKYKIIDSEKIGFYDFNTIDYIENENKIKINSNIPLGFEIKVSKFQIEIIETGNIIEEKVRTRLF